MTTSHPAATTRNGLPGPDDGCSCTPHWQDAGGGHTEFVPEYDPACPEHSDHLYDPRLGAWVLRPDERAVAARTLRSFAEQPLPLSRGMAIATATECHKRGCSCGNPAPEQMAREIAAATQDAAHAEAARIEYGGDR